MLFSCHVLTLDRGISMSSMITNMASPEASGEPGPGIVQNYRARLQALGYSSGLIGKCLRTILHLITWLSANGTGIETLDKWRPPSLRKGTFKGVQDESLAMLAGT